MAHFFAFFTLFRLSLTFFRQEVPFNKGWFLSESTYFVRSLNENYRFILYESDNIV